MTATGPRTPEGKAASSRNSLRHGLTAAELILPGEDPADYQALHAALMEAHHPAEGLETVLLDQIAQSTWRLNRARRIEREALEQDLTTPENTTTTTRLDKILRYMTAIEREFHRAIAQLLTLQTARIRNAAAASKPKVTESAVQKAVAAYIWGPEPTPPAPEPQNYETNPRHAAAGARNAIRFVRNSVIIRAVGVLALVAPLFAADLDVPKTLKAVENRYNHAKTLEVSFSETYKAQGRTRTESGNLFLRKPGRMRWQYTDPAGKLFVSDGKNVYFYNPDTNRAEKMKLKETEDMRAPMAFLLGRLDFDKDFGRYTARPEDNGVFITAQPKSDRLPYREVSFLVGPDNRDPAPHRHRAGFLRPRRFPSPEKR